MDTYKFRIIENCEMCGDSTVAHKILGFRLNQSQGFNPKNKTGISVSIQKCSVCNLVYANPQPIPLDIQSHYGTPPEKYWVSAYFKWEPNYFSRQIREVKKLIKFKNGMKSLDIGAGLGKAMLSLENSGYEAHGLEPSLSFHERAIKKMNIDPIRLKLGTIEELDYEDCSFDFITFGAVFEHLYKPAKCLEKSLQWLKPGGIIHIEVPSSQWFLPRIMNFYFRLIGTNYVTNLSPMHSPYHLYEFDLQSFIKLSLKNGFSIEKYYYDVCTIYHIPKIFHPILNYYMRKTNTGMQLSVYLKKSKS